MRLIDIANMIKDNDIKGTLYFIEYIDGCEYIWRYKDKMFVTMAGEGVFGCMEFTRDQIMGDLERCGYSFGEFKQLSRKEAFIRLL